MSLLPFILYCCRLRYLAVVCRSSLEDKWGNPVRYLRLLFFLIFLACLKKATDILFVLDSSSSIWFEDYKKQLQFVADLVDSFKVENGISQVRVGAITFSDQAYLEFPLGHYSKPAQMKEAISKFIHRTGGTNTAKALQLVRSQLHIQTENRKGPIAVIVVTDGQSIDREATKAEAEKLHQLDINVYAIGVGDAGKYDINELKSIASDPIRGVYTVASYSALQEIAQKFYAQPCEGKWPLLILITPKYI